MRLQEKVDIPDIGIVIVQEMTLGEVKTLLSRLKSDNSDMEWHQIITQGVDRIIENFADFITLPEKKRYGDLTWSNIQKIWEAFCKLNPFFRPVSSIAKMLGTLSPEQLKQFISMRSS